MRAIRRRHLSWGEALGLAESSRPLLLGSRAGLVSLGCVAIAGLLLFFSACSALASQLARPDAGVRSSGCGERFATILEIVLVVVECTYPYTSPPLSKYAELFAGFEFFNGQRVLAGTRTLSRSIWRTCGRAYGSTMPSSRTTRVSVRSSFLRHPSRPFCPPSPSTPTHPSPKPSLRLTCSLNPNYV